MLASNTYNEIADYINATDTYFSIEPGGEITVDITDLTDAGQQLARWALAAWESVANLTFREVEDGANIKFDDEGQRGWTTYAFSSDGLTSALVNVPKTWIDKYGDGFGSWAFMTYLHEIGHALGLNHAFNYQGSATDDLYEVDSYQTSIMSYLDERKVVPITPMMADILAIQKKYGAPETNPGDTVYGYQSNVDGYLGQVFAAIAEQDGELVPVTLTLFDSGGEDRLDLRTDKADQRVDLRPEGISDVYGLKSNWRIARDTVIENLIAGQGDDQVIANAVANELDGGPGSDTVLYVGSGCWGAGGLARRDCHGRSCAGRHPEEYRESARLGARRCVTRRCRRQHAARAGRRRHPGRQRRARRAGRRRRQ